VAVAFVLLRHASRWRLAGAVKALRARLTDWAAASPEAWEEARGRLAEQARRMIEAGPKEG
jgi:hypothetical protein